MAGKLSCLDLAIGAGGLGFESQVGRVGPCAANGSLPLECFFKAMLI